MDNRKKKNENIRGNIAICTACLVATVIVIGISYAIWNFRAGGGKESPTGDVSPVFTKINEFDIPETVQIVELNDSHEYYTMSIRQDVDCVYFYAVGYDSDGVLVDKSIITTMPVGMEGGTEVVVNSTFPDASYPSYAVGFLKNDNTHEYYILKHDEKKGVNPEFVIEKETFFILEEDYDEIPDDAVEP